ncbi:MAG: Ricin-type beta-trefoil lectin domain-like [Pseudomonadota bacterium]
MKFSTSRITCPLLLTSVALIVGCGAEGFPVDAQSDQQVDEAALNEGGMSLDESAEFGQNEEALASFCGGEDSNMLSAGLAVAIGQELGRWDVNTDFAVVSGKLELSATGKLRCGATGASCPKTYALLRLQDDATSNITNHSPSAYRTKLTGWYDTQKNALTRKVNDLLNVDEGVFRIKSLLSGKYIVPAAGSTTAGAALQQSDAYSSTTAAQWMIHLRGTQRQLKNIKSGLCMDLQSDVNGQTAIVQKACNSAATQDFRIGALNAGEWTLRSKHNLAFMPSGSSTANNAAIVQNTVTGGTAEKFVFERQGSGPWRDLLETITAVYSLKVAHTGMAMAVQSNSSSDGIPVVQQPYVATDDRFHWYVTQLGSFTYPNGLVQNTYQMMNRATGKCADFNGSQLVQKTCNTGWTQRIGYVPTGNLRNVLYTSNGKTVDVSGGSTSSGAAVVEGGSNTWQMYNMWTMDPIIAIEPHRLTYSHTTNDGPCGKYYWYNIKQPNGNSLANPANSWIQLIFSGGKQTPTGADVNPHIAQKVSGDMVAIDPVYGLDGSGTSTTGSCTAACVSISTTNIAGNCCSCSGVSKKFVKSSSNPVTYLCL